MQRLENILEFYGICSRIVRGWSAYYLASGVQESKSRRLNTFGVVRSLTDLDADNLQKTANYSGREFFFSRPWHDSGYLPNALRVDYPALICREETFTISDPLTPAGSRRRTVHRIVLMVADQPPYRENSAQRPGTERTIEEVGNDCRLRMAEFLLVLGRFVYAVGMSGGGIELFRGWFDRVHLDALVTDGTIARYIMDDSLSGYISGVSPAQAEVFYEVGGDNLTICTVTMEIETSSCPVSMPVITYDDPTITAEHDEIYDGTFLVTT